MDMLGNQKMRQIITEHYHMSDEPRLVERAIKSARYMYMYTCMCIMYTVHVHVHVVC